MYNLLNCFISYSSNEQYKGLEENDDRVDCETKAEFNWVVLKYNVGQLICSLMHSLEPILLHQRTCKEIMVAVYRLVNVGNALYATLMDLLMLLRLLHREMKNGTTTLQSVTRGVKPSPSTVVTSQSNSYRVPEHNNISGN